MDEYNAGYVAGVEEVLHLIEIAGQSPGAAVDYASGEVGEGYSARWREGREDALTKMYYLFRRLNGSTVTPEEEEKGK